MTMFSLPADWLTTLTGNTASIISGILPIVLVLYGVVLSFFVIRFIISLVRGGDRHDYTAEVDQYRRDNYDEDEDEDF